MSNVNGEYLKVLMGNSAPTKSNCVRSKALVKTLNKVSMVNERPRQQIKTICFYFQYTSYGYLELHLLVFNERWGKYNI